MGRTAFLEFPHELITIREVSSPARFGHAYAMIEIEFEGESHGQFVMSKHAALKVADKLREMATSEAPLCRAEEG